MRSLGRIAPCVVVGLIALGGWVGGVGQSPASMALTSNVSTRVQAPAVDASGPTRSAPLVAERVSGRASAVLTPVVTATPVTPPTSTPPVGSRTAVRATTASATAHALHRPVPTPVQPAQPLAVARDSRPTSGPPPSRISPMETLTSTPAINGSFQPVSDTASHRTITRLAIPRIGLSEDVVGAPLIHQGDEVTWAVPPFHVGHAQYTANAGEVGNAVLIGHVASLYDGDVFHSLGLTRVGDSLHIFSGAQEFDYRVIDRRYVSRTDVSVVYWTPTPTATLITCAGPWVPSIGDYADRLVVRAQLVSQAST